MDLVVGGLHREHLAAGHRVTGHGVVVDLEAQGPRGSPGAPRSVRRNSPTAGGYTPRYSSNASRAASRSPPTCASTRAPSPPPRSRRKSAISTTASSGICSPTSPRRNRRGRGWRITRPRCGRGGQHGGDRRAHDLDVVADLDPGAVKPTFVARQGRRHRCATPELQRSFPWLDSSKQGFSMNPCPSARPGVQTEGRLRGAPAARRRVAVWRGGGSRPEPAGSRSELRRGGAPSLRARLAGAHDNEACTGARASRVAGGGVERPAAPHRRPPGVTPEGAAKAAGPSVTAGRSPNRAKPAAKAAGESLRPTPGKMTAWRV